MDNNDVLLKTSLKCWIDSTKTENIIFRNNSFNLIEKIFDNTTNNCDLTALAGEEPKYILSNTKGKIFFDGENNKMSFANLQSNLTNILKDSHSLFFVFEPLYNDNDLSLFSYSDDVVFNSYYIGNSSKKFLLKKSTDTKTINDNYILDNGIEILAIARDKDKINKRMFSGLIETINIPIVTEDSYVIKNIFLATGTENFFRGYIYEIMIFDKILDNQEMMKIRNYLYSKWQIDNGFYNNLEIRRINKNSTNYETEYDVVLKNPAIIIISHGKKWFWLL